MYAVVVGMEHHDLGFILYEFNTMLKVGRVIGNSCFEI